MCEKHVKDDAMDELPTKLSVVGHSQCRGWFPHCVDGRGVGQRHAAVEEDPATLPTILSDRGFMRGAGLERARETGAMVGDDHLLVFWEKDKRFQHIGASSCHHLRCAILR